LRRIAFGIRSYLGISVMVYCIFHVTVWTTFVMLIKCVVVNRQNQPVSSESYPDELQDMRSDLDDLTLRQNGRPTPGLENLIELPTLTTSNYWSFDEGSGHSPVAIRPVEPLFKKLVPISFYDEAFVDISNDFADLNSARETFTVPPTDPADSFTIISVSERKIRPRNGPYDALTNSTRRDPLQASNDFLDSNDAQWSFTVRPIQPEDSPAILSDSERETGFPDDPLNEFTISTPPNPLSPANAFSTTPTPSIHKFILEKGQTEPLYSSSEETTPIPLMSTTQTSTEEPYVTISLPNEEDDPAPAPRPIPSEPFDTPTPILTEHSSTFQEVRENVLTTRSAYDKINDAEVKRGPKLPHKKGSGVVTSENKQNSTPKNELIQRRMMSAFIRAAGRRIVSRDVPLTTKKLNMFKRSKSSRMPRKRMLRKSRPHGKIHLYEIQRNISG
uniref:WASH_WAHD domain-containing protein n=1 Tax=Haemonchus contortus TaxID=6289 RepID=A0A7I4Y6Y6_HAECO